MKRNAFPFLAVLSLAAGITIQPAWPQENHNASATSLERQEAAVSLLFVQSARGLAYNQTKGTLTLENVSPVVTFFSDRPHRIAGHVLLEGFLQAWAEGSDSFQKDPPNVEVSILEPDGIRSAVVELSDPKADANQLTYNVKVLEGELPATGGACSLFIDGLFYGAARGAAGGAIIGAACGDAGEGAAIGAAVGGVASAARMRRERELEMERLMMEQSQASQGTAKPPAAPAAPATATTPKPPAATATVDVPNANGSYMPVKLTQVPGGWQGPKGEIYPNFPTVDELKKLYGL
ncbi:MAG: glycine zipper family protein [Verrucomicrobia bacterium]|nr:glycine zipper family protein [Verrucomicrobiota bacterium]